MSELWSWNVETPRPEPEAYVVDDNDFVFEADSYGTAQAWIEAMHDHEENQGHELRPYRIVACRATPGGRDIR